MANDYKVGDLIEHHTYGPCVVVGRETKNVAGAELVFVSLKRRDGGATVLVPLEKMDAVAARTPDVEMVRLEALLVFPGTAKSWRASLEGVRLTQTTMTGGAKPRETQRTLPSQHAATAAFEKAVGSKLDDGFVQLGDRRAARPGDVLLHLALADWGPTPVYDLSPDGKSLVCAREVEGKPTLDFVDVDSGIQRRAHQPPWKVDFVRFGADGRTIVYSNRSETQHLDLERGTVTTVAAFDSATDAAASMESPRWDPGRKRLLAFDSHDRCKVLDAELHPLLEVTAAPRNAVSYAGVLSPSGEKLALQLSSSGEGRDEVQIWSVASRTVVQRLQVKRGAMLAGFDASERRLVLATADALAAVELQTGKELWAFAGYPGLPAQSRDGRRFIFQRNWELAVLDAETGTLQELKVRTSLPVRGGGRMAWSDDESTLAIANGQRDLMVVKT